MYGICIVKFLLVLMLCGDQKAVENAAQIPSQTKLTVQLELPIAHPNLYREV